MILQPHSTLKAPLSATTGRKSLSTLALREIQSQGRYLFDTAEFAQLTRRDPANAAVAQALQRLVRQERIVLVSKRPAHWVIIPPEHAHYGAPPVLWWIDAYLKPVEPYYYVGLLSAARHWGSAHYALQTTQVAVSRRRSNLRVGQLQVDFFPKLGVARTPVELVRKGQAPWRVSTREATILDLIRHMSAVGGIEAVARIAKDLTPDLRVAALGTALDAMGQVPVVQRLGFVLESLGAKKLLDTVDRWLSGRRFSLQPLERGADSATQVHPRWGIRFSQLQQERLEELT